MRSSTKTLFFNALPLCIAVYLVYTVAATFGGRVFYPHDLEWMEGGMLTHAWRLKMGLPLYIEPSPEFIPFIYPPGYAALLAGLSHWFDLGHPLGRMISIFGSGLAALSACLLVWRYDGRRVGLLFGTVAAATYLGCYAGTGAFMDLVRPDALAVGLLAAALAVGFERGRRMTVLAGLLLFASFTVKHNMAVFGVPMMLGIWARDGRKGLVTFVTASAVPALLWVGWMQIGSDGRFLDYILGVPSSHRVVGMRVWPGTPWELADQLPFLFAVVGFWLMLKVKDWSGSGRIGALLGLPLLLAGGVGLLCFESQSAVLPTTGGPLDYFVGAISSVGLPPVSSAAKTGVVVSAIGISGVVLSFGAILVTIYTRIRNDIWCDQPPWRAIYGVGVGASALFLVALMRGHHGGFINVYMPFFMVGAVAFGVLLSKMSQASNAVAILGVGLAVGQLLWGIDQMPATRYQPTSADRDAHARVVKVVGDVEGPVLSPFAAWLPVQAGHDPSFHLMALWDINHRDGPFYGYVPKIKGQITEEHWGTVLDSKKGMKLGINKAYEERSRLPIRGGEMSLKSGWRAKPMTVLTPAD